MRWDWGREGEDGGQDRWTEAEQEVNRAYRREGKRRARGGLEGISELEEHKGPKCDEVCDVRTGCDMITLIDLKAN